MTGSQRSGYKSLRSKGEAFRRKWYRKVDGQRVSPTRLPPLQNETAGHLPVAVRRQQHRLLEMNAIIRRRRLPRPVEATSIPSPYPIEPFGSRVVVVNGF